MRILKPENLAGRQDLRVAWDGNLHSFWSRAACAWTLGEAVSTEPREALRLRQVELFIVLVLTMGSTVGCFGDRLLLAAAESGNPLWPFG